MTLEEQVAELIYYRVEVPPEVEEFDLIRRAGLDPNRAPIPDSARFELIAGRLNGLCEAVSLLARALDALAPT